MTVKLTKGIVTLHDIDTRKVYRRMDLCDAERDLRICRELGDTLQDYDTTDRAGNPMRVVLHVTAPYGAYSQDPADGGGVYEFAR